MCETLFWKLEPCPLLPTPYKHLYLRIEMLLKWRLFYFILFCTPSNMKLKRQGVSDHVITLKELNNKWTSCIDTIFVTIY